MADLAYLSPEDALSAGYDDVAEAEAYAATATTPGERRAKIIEKLAELLQARMDRGELPPFLTEAP